MFKKLIYFRYVSFVMGSLFVHSTCMAVVPAVLRHDVEDVIELSKRAAQHITGHEAVVLIETEDKIVGTGFLVDPWTVITAGHIDITDGSTKVSLQSANLEVALKSMSSGDMRVKANEGKTALCLKTIMSAYSSPEPLNPYESIVEGSLATYAPQKHWDSKIDAIASGECYAWEPFVRGISHEDFRILKLDRSLEVSHYLECENHPSVPFRALDTSILGYAHSVFTGKDTIFSDSRTQIAMKNRVFYSSYGDTFYTPFTGYDQDKPSRFDVYSHMDPLAGITGSFMAGSPLIDNTTNRVIGVVSGRIRQPAGIFPDTHSISLNISQPIVRYYDLIQSSLGKTG